jgi:hypothetical protein
LSADFGCEVSGNFFEDDREATCGFDCLRVLKEFSGFRLLLGTDGVRAEFVDLLWGQSKMSLDWDAGADYSLN